MAQYGAINNLNPLGNMPVAPSIFNSSFTQTNEGEDHNGTTYKSVPNFKKFPKTPKPRSFEKNIFIYIFDHIKSF